MDEVREAPQQNFGEVAERTQVARLIHVSDDDEVIQAPEGACCAANRAWELMWRSWHNVSGQWFCRGCSKNPRVRSLKKRDISTPVQVPF